MARTGWKRRVMAATVGAWMAAAAACGGGSGAQNGGGEEGTGGPQKVTIGLTSFNSLHIEFLVAQVEHLMRPYGVEVELPTLQNVQLGLPGVLSGDLQFTPATNVGAFLGQNEARNLKLVAVESTGLPYVLIAGPEIKSLSDLRGKAIGVNAAGASLDYLAIAGMLADEDPSLLKEVEFVSAGPPSARVAALTSGKVQAVGSFPPASLKLLGNDGLHVVAESPAYRGDHAQYTFVVADQKWYEENHDVAVNFMRGYLASLEWLNDPKNKDKVIEDIATTMKVSEEDATKTYETFVVDLKMFPDPKDAVIDPAQMVPAMDFLRAAGVEGLPANDDLGWRFDNSLVEAAEKAGY